MSSNMYPYNRPTEGGVLNVTENGSVSLAGTNYSEINVNVSGGGGGGGDLGYPITVAAYTSGSAPLGFAVTSEEIYLYFSATVSSQPAIPTGATYLIGYFSDADGIGHVISSASDVTATISYDTGDTSETFTDYAIVDGDDGKAIQLTTTAAAPSQDPPPLIIFTIAT